MPFKADGCQQEKSKGLPEKLTPKVIMELTSGHFGADKFREFLV